MLSLSISDSSRISVTAIQISLYRVVIIISFDYSINCYLCLDKTLESWLVIGRDIKGRHDSFALPILLFAYPFKGFYC